MEFDAQMKTSAELTQTLEEESKEPSIAEKSGRAKMGTTYGERDADRDQDSDVEDMVPSTKRNMRDKMNLNNALKQARKSRKQGAKLNLFE